MDTKEITQNILAVMENGWNNTNGNEFAAPFKDISDFVDIRGVLHQNITRQKVADEHQGILMSIYKNSKVSYKCIQASLIDSNTILAHAGAELQAPTGPLAGKNSSVITLVLINSDGKWTIRAFHNTMVMKQ
ncbi:MAG: SgcJ/EcaC family oxidoreductase [Ignavibacteria bacterium]|nr:SgcJ/EcaC family oxidoreductase [Ignavibacteria bacterium]